jgi:hypothetical protein
VRQGDDCPDPNGVFCPQGSDGCMLLHPDFPSTTAPKGGPQCEDDEVQENWCNDWTTWYIGGACEKYCKLITYNKSCGCYAKDLPDYGAQWQGPNCETVVE